MQLSNLAICLHKERFDPSKKVGRRNPVHLFAFDTAKSVFDLNVEFDLGRRTVKHKHLLRNKIADCLGAFAQTDIIQFLAVHRSVFMHNFGFYFVQSDSSEQRAACLALKLHGLKWSVVRLYIEQHLKLTVVFEKGQRLVNNCVLKHKRLVCSNCYRLVELLVQVKALNIAVCT